MGIDVFALQMAMSDKRMSHNMLAEKAGMSRQYLGTIIRRGTAKPITIGKLARALGVDPSELVKEPVVNDGRITLSDLRDMEKTRNTITPAIAAKYMECDPYAINLLIRDRPEKVPFPYFKSGNRVKIILAGFIRWAEGRETA